MGRASGGLLLGVPCGTTAQTERARGPGAGDCRRRSSATQRGARGERDRDPGGLPPGDRRDTTAQTEKSDHRVNHWLRRWSAESFSPPREGEPFSRRRSMTQGTKDLLAAMAEERNAKEAKRVAKSQEVGATLVFGTNGQPCPGEICLSRKVEHDSGTMQHCIVLHLDKNKVPWMFTTLNIYGGKLGA